MTIKTTNLLTSYEMNCVNELIAQCADTDGFTPPVFTGDDESGVNFPCFFLAYDNDEPHDSDTPDKLIAFFPVFSADGRECEIYGVIPREYRTMDIFGNMVHCVLRAIKSSLPSVTKIFFVNDGRNTFFKSCLEKNDFQIDFSTCLMKLNIDKNYRDLPYLPGCRIETEKEEGIVKFFLLTSQKKETGRSLSSHIRSRHGKRIGRCLCSIYEHSANDSMNTYEDVSICIHDVFIAKPYRNRGLGTFLINSAISLLNGQSPVRTVILNADAHNKAAMKLYLNLGFQVSQQLDYYIMNV